MEMVFWMRAKSATPIEGGGSCDLNCTRPRCGNGVQGLDSAGVPEECDDAIATTVMPVRPVKTPDAVMAIFKALKSVTMETNSIRMAAATPASYRSAETASCRGMRHAMTGIKTTTMDVTIPAVRPAVEMVWWIWTPAKSVMMAMTSTPIIA